MDSASSWIQVKETIKTHSGMSKGAKGLGIGCPTGRRAVGGAQWLWQSGQEAEVRAGAMFTSVQSGAWHQPHRGLTQPDLMVAM